MSRQALSLLAGAAVAVFLAACGGGGNGTSGSQGGEAAKITHEQWMAVSTDSTKDEVTGKLGKPQTATTYSGLTDSVSYQGPPGVIATFTFDPDTGKFMSKDWVESTHSKTTVSASEFARVSNGMTEQQVENLLGVPSLREEYLTTGTISGTGQSITPGTLQRCVWYVWTPNSPNAASVCFDQAGKVNQTQHTSPAPA
jgi:outer membrane protein assembly factor BamE (lipoprotein component of BamABCDE complex)